MLADDPLDGVADPYGMGRAKVGTTADELDQLTRTLAAAAPWAVA